MQVRLDKAARDALWSGLVLSTIGLATAGALLALRAPELRVMIGAFGLRSWAALEAAGILASLLLNLALLALCALCLRRRRARDLRRLRAWAAVGAVVNLASPVGLILMLLIAVQAHRALGRPPEPAAAA